MIKEKHVRIIGIIMSLVSAIIVFTCILLVPKPFSIHSNTITSIIIVIITGVFTMLMAVGIIMLTDYKHLSLLMSDENNNETMTDDKKPVVESQDDMNMEEQHINHS